MVDLGIFSDIAYAALALLVAALAIYLSLRLFGKIAKFLITLVVILLALWFLFSDHSILQYAVYTLVDGRPQVVFEDEEGSLVYLGNGSFHYVVSLPTGMGQVTVSLSQDGTQILWEDFYFTLDDIFGGGVVAIYHNTTGSHDLTESELTDWTMEYFYAWEPEYENLPMIPFSTAD